jgi:ornithine carbamoyltransferase
MARTFAHQSVITLAEYATVPVINALSDFSHPCQALADFLTISEKKGDLKGLTLAYVGDGNNVAHSLMFTGAKTGVNVRVVCPEGFEPKAEAVQMATEDARETGALITVTHDINAGVAGADVIYTDVWASMGQESEAEARKALFQPFQVNAALMAKAKEDAIFMHCLPAHRGDEVTDEVVDSWQSVVFDEAENRLHAQKAVMLLLLVGEDLA